MTDTVNELSTCYITATFKDKAGTATAPTSARYRIDCTTSGQQIKDWTTIVAPSATEEITIPSSENAIQIDRNAKEARRVTVEGTYGADDKILDAYDYDLINMSNVP